MLTYIIYFFEGGGRLMTQRREEYYHGFKLVAGLLKGIYQGRAYHKLAEKMSVSGCDSIEDAFNTLRQKVNNFIQAHPDIYGDISQEQRKRLLVPSHALPKDVAGGEVFLDVRMVEIRDYVKSKYGYVVVFIQCGYFWEVYGDDATFCHRLFGWKLADKGYDTFTGIPIQNEKFLNNYELKTKGYALVPQVDYGLNSEEIYRQVGKVIIPSVK